MLKTYTPAELAEILTQHRLWRETGGDQGARADLTDANLAGANLTDANLARANLDGATLPAFQIVPEIGQFVGFKKVLRRDGSDAVLTLLIPSDARRVNSTGRKCRADRAVVIASSASDAEYRSSYDPAFTYRLGAEVSVPDFDPDIRVECTRGIHFFITRAEAETYT